MKSTLVADSFFGATASMAPVLSRDMTLMLGQLGIKLVRAAVVEIDTMTFQSTWRSDQGIEVDLGGPDHGPDTTFPWAAALVAKLDEQHSDQTRSQKLGPRFWAFAWRFEDGCAVVAAALYNDRRDQHSDADTALVRLVCDVGLRGVQTDAETETIESEETPMEVWPTFERRRHARPAGSGRRSHLVGATVAALVLGVTVAATGVAFQQAADQQSQVEQLQALSEATMTQSLASSLATGDYGEVQMALSSFGSLGYFKGAVVTNSRQRVISTAGKAGSARVGEEVPPSVALAARSFDLTQGTTTHGQLLVMGMPTERSQGMGVRWLLAAVVLGCLATGAALALLIARYRQRGGQKH